MRPFTEQSISQILNDELGLARENKELSTEYKILLQEIPFPPNFPPLLKDIISKLLDIHPETRLGAGPGGPAELKAHPFFASIDWSLLELKHLEPPFIPSRRALDSSPQYSSFETMMASLGKSSWLAEPPSSKMQKYFKCWYADDLC